MEFEGLLPFPLASPTIEIGEKSKQFDLHNDGELRQFIVDFRDNSTSLVWTLKRPAWTSPSRPAPWQRNTVASLVLRFSAVRSLVVSGELMENAFGSSTLDFIEYSLDRSAIGQVRIVMLNAAEISIVAGRCELRKIEAP